MRTRRHEVGVNLAVSFDDDAGQLIVSRYERPFPGFQGDWQDVATFTKEEDWYTSEHQLKVIGDDNIAMVAYFWHDLAEKK